MRWVAYGLGLRLLLGTTLSATAGDWPSWGGPNRDWITSEELGPGTFTEQGSEILWKGKVGKGFSPITTWDEAVFTVGSHRGVDSVFRLSRETGDVVWKYSYVSPDFSKEHEGGPAASCEIQNGRVYTLSRGGEIHCLDAEAGEVIWSKKIQLTLAVRTPFYGFTNSPLLHENRLIIDAGVTAAFDPQSGDLLWKTRDYGAAYASPKLFGPQGKERIALFNSEGVVILNPSSGDEEHFFPWKTRFNNNVAGLSISNNRIFLSSGYGTGGALIEVSDNRTPREIYQTKAMRAQFSSPVLLDGKLYGFDGDYEQPDSSFRCLDFNTGKVHWTEPTLQVGTVLLAGDVLVILSGDGELILSPPRTDQFQVLARWQASGGRCWTPPTISDGRLYIRNSEGEITCFDVQGSE